MNPDDAAVADVTRRVVSAISPAARRRLDLGSRWIRLDAYDARRLIAVVEREESET